MAEETAVAAAPVETPAASAPAEVETVETDTSEVPEVETPETPEGEEPSPEQPDAEKTEESPEEPKDEELAEFRGSDGAMLRELYKKAPGLQDLLTKFPYVQGRISALARRDAALREQNITVAELNEYRERLPNGLQDLATIEQEVQELGQIDEAFYNKQGGTLIKHMHEADPEAAIALFKEIPLQWSRLDPDSYNDTFAAIVDSTFKRDRIAETALRAYRRAEQKGDKDQMEDAAALYNYLQSFGKKDVEETPQARRLREDREAFHRERQDGQKKSYETFSQTYLGEAKKFESDMVRNSPLFKKLPQAITEAKKSRMVDMIRQQVRQHLTKSPAFMAQWRPAHNSMNLEKALQAVKGPQGWQPWLVNMYVRRILAEELPGIIEGNNAANGKKRSAAARTAISNRPPQKTPSPASKPANREYTMEEIMAPDFETKNPGVLDALLEKQRARR